MMVLITTLKEGDLFVHEGIVYLWKWRGESVPLNEDTYTWSANTGPVTAARYGWVRNGYCKLTRNRIVNRKLKPTLMVQRIKLIVD